MRFSRQLSALRCLNQIPGITTHVPAKTPQASIVRCETVLCPPNTPHDTIHGNNYRNPDRPIFLWQTRIDHVEVTRAPKYATRYA